MQHVQVGIIGAGPAGLLLSQLLHVNGIGSIVLERRDRAYVEGRIRAGVLEQGTVDLLARAGVGERLAQQGLVHEGVELSVDGRRVHIDFRALTGQAVTIYGQTEVVKDLLSARLAAGADIRFEAGDVTLGEIDSTRPQISFRLNGERERVSCDFIAGCDGFHGVSRPSVPGGVLKTYERAYPFAWLGILAEAPPPAAELIYASHERGFALFSMRSRRISRHYLQCLPDEDLDEWPDERVWEELRKRLGRASEGLLEDGPVRDKSVIPMRSFVVEPMRYGRLLLAGDAAHIVPPTGAKGLNLAASDVHYLARALIAFYGSGNESLLDAYSETALARVWKAQRFSWWMTSLLHNSPGEHDFEDRIQRAELDYLLCSRGAQSTLAENYVGLPY